MSTFVTNVEIIGNPDRDGTTMPSRCDVVECLNRHCYEGFPRHKKDTEYGVAGYAQLRRTCEDHKHLLEDEPDVEKQYSGDLDE